MLQHMATHFNSVAWIFIFLLCLSRTIGAPSLESEAQALLESGWWSHYSNDTSRRCTWPGISCDGDGSVTQISVPFTTLGAEVGHKFHRLNFSSFPNLVSLDVRGQDVDGSIPPEIGSLSKLKCLYLLDNNLTGELPPSLGQLSQLVVLDVSSNNIEGTIPLELGRLANLSRLNLAMNFITGELPSTFGKLVTLTFLDVSYNSLSGSIPPEIGYCKFIETMLLVGNQLIGSIPHEIGNLHRLKTLDISCNTLSGSIPTEIGQCLNLSTMVLNNNWLGGSIPHEIGNLHRLETLDISYNGLSGSIPLEIGQCSNLSIMILNNNRLSGSIPHEIGNLHRLKTLDISYNGLSGSIPTEVGQCSNLSTMVLNNNRLSGSIPHEIGNLHRLETLDISYNGLSGFIPTEVGQCSNLSTMVLNNNRLSGNIPHQIGNLHRLETLDIDYNGLSGSISTEIVSLFMGKIWIEVCLISARGLRRTSSFWKLQWFAVGWIDPNNKYCTKIDACGNSNPVWKTKFATLLDDSNFQEATLQVEVYSREPLFLRESLQGTATVALREFLAKHTSNSEAPPSKIEEVGSYQLRKKNSNKPQGFVDVSIRVSEEKDEPSSYPVNEGGFVLMNRSNNMTLPNEGVSGNVYPGGAMQLPQAPFQPPANHSQISPPFKLPLPYPASYSNTSAAGPSCQPAPGPNYQPHTTPPPPPPPSNTGYIPTLLPRADLGGGTYVNMPSSTAAAPGRGLRPGVGMGLGAGALAAGAVIFGDDFISGFDALTGLQDASLTIATDPLF